MHGHLSPAGVPHPGPRRTCPRCPARRNGSTRQYRKLRDDVLRYAQVCHICGEPPTADDPLVADHVVPHALGGPTVRSNLRPAHASCNGTKGAAL